MIDEITDSGFMLELFRKEKGLANQTGNTQAKYVIEAFNVSGFAGFYPLRFVAFTGEYIGIGLPEIRMDEGALIIDWRQRIPEILDRRSGTVSHSAVLILGHPDTKLLHFRTYKWPYLVHLNLTRPILWG